MASKNAKMPVYVSLPLEAVRAGKVRPGWGESDIWDRRSHLWLGKQIGYYPQILYPAADEQQASDFSGYGSQFSRSWHDFNDDGKLVTMHAVKGNPRNRVMAVFSFDSLDKPVFIDDSHFVSIMNDVANRRQPERIQDQRCTFKRSWDQSKWLRLAKAEPSRICVLAPHLDLRNAVELWIRNDATRRELEALGFTNVRVKRMRVRK